ncbi:Protein MHF1 homolog [Linum perenne]
MEVGEDGSDLDRGEDDSVGELLKDRFRLSAISLVESQGKKNGMEVSETITACISDLAFKFTAHRNKNLTSVLRSLSSEMRAKEPQSERKRKKTSFRKESTKADDDIDMSDVNNVVHLPDLD